jgi:hypothetical protein
MAGRKTTTSMPAAVVKSGIGSLTALHIDYSAHARSEKSCKLLRVLHAMSVVCRVHATKSPCGCSDISRYLVSVPAV